MIYFVATTSCGLLSSVVFLPIYTLRSFIYCGLFPLRSFSIAVFSHCGLFTDRSFCLELDFLCFCESFFDLRWKQFKTDPFEASNDDFDKSGTYPHFFIVYFNFKIRWVNKYFPSQGVSFIYNQLTDECL